MRSIEDLRGKKFFHHDDKSLIYIIGRGKEGKTIIHWKDKANTAVYKDEQVVDYFDRGVWVEINNK